MTATAWLQGLSVAPGWGGGGGSSTEGSSGLGPVRVSQGTWKEKGQCVERQRPKVPWGFGGSVPWDGALGEGWGPGTGRGCRLVRRNRPGLGVGVLLPALTPVHP